MDKPQEQEKTNPYTQSVSRIMEIEDITWGNPTAIDSGLDHSQNYLVRYRGQLTMDPEVAYSQLVADLRGDRITPIFLREDGRQTIFLVDDPYTPIVSKVLHITDIKWRSANQSGLSMGAKRGLAVKYLGKLRIDSQKAYDQLAKELLPLKMTPLFRMAGDQHEVTLLEGILETRPSNPWINLILFLLTVISVLLAGTPAPEGPPAGSFLQQAIDWVTNLGQGIPFAASILAILLAHEFGHYLAARYHRTEVTLPYFIPFPTAFGTMGAAIQLKEPPKNKRVLLDIGAAGPLAGLVVAIPILLLGLTLSNLDQLPVTLPREGFLLEGNSILYLLAKYVVFGQWLPAPANYGDASPLLYWVQYFFTGLPTPLGGIDVLIHPVAWAGWAGLLVTALNLIPAGQLDGGHLIYTLIGRRARGLVWVIIGVLIPLGLVWQGWWLWVILILMLGRVHAAPLDQITALDPRRKAVAILGLIIFFLVFTPVPLRVIAGPGFLP